MLAHIRPAFVVLVCMTALTGIAYPLAVYGIARLAFPWQAGGSLIEKDGKIVGSALIGQAFVSAQYFHGRPSGAGQGYDAAASSGSNYGPTSQALADRVAADVAAQQVGGASPIPADLVTASGSGLDPHITPAAAEYQVPRIAAARGVSEAQLRAFVAEIVERPVVGLIGERQVNVLRLNIALDERFPLRAAPPADPAPASDSSPAGAPQ